MEKIEIKEESIAEDNTSEMIDNDNSDDLDISQTKNQNSQKNKVVEKVLQMRYRRGMKQYQVLWKSQDGCEGSNDSSWHFLNEDFEGFRQQVAVFEQDRKMKNLKGIGQTSETLPGSKSSRKGRGSWYYLSSSEDEGTMLKDDFWKNLDEGKLDLSCDMYSVVKEAGHKLANQDQDPMRVTRSRVKKVDEGEKKGGKKKNKKKLVIEDDVNEDENVSEKRKKKKKIAKEVDKSFVDDDEDVEENNGDESITKSEKKEKVDAYDVVVVSSGGSGKDDSTNRKEAFDSTNDSEMNTSLEADEIVIQDEEEEEKEDGGDKSLEKSKEEKKVKKMSEESEKLLEETLKEVVEDSLKWYEEHFEDEEEEEEMRKKKLKRKKEESWTHFLEVKKIKTSIEKFKSLHGDDEHDVKSKPNNQSTNQEETKEVEEKPDVEMKEEVKEVVEIIEAPKTGDDVTKDSNNNKDQKNVTGFCDLDEDKKRELVKKVSMAIMKGKAPPLDNNEVEESKEISCENVSTIESIIEAKANESKHEAKANAHELVSKGPFDLPEVTSSDLLLSSDALSDDPKNYTFDDLEDAVKRNEVDMVKKVIKKLGRFDPQNRRVSDLLWTAVKNGYNTALSLLACNNADVNSTNREKRTPLIYAAEKGMHTTAYVLGLLGADWDAKSSSGDTAMIKAIKGGHRNVVMMLLAAGYNLANMVGQLTLTQFAKQVNSHEVIDVFNLVKMRMNTELVQKASQCMETNVRVEHGLFGVQCLRAKMAGGVHHIDFQCDILPYKKSKGALLFVGHGDVNADDVVCELRGNSIINKATLNNHPLTAISSDPNFIFTFCPLRTGFNSLRLHASPLAPSNCCVKLIVCAYLVSLAA